MNVRTTFECNLGCEYCISKKFRAKNKKSLYEVPASIIPQIVKEYDVDTVTFCGHGETVLAKNFKELFLEAAKHVRKIELISNGSGRNIEWWESLFDDMPDGIEYKIILSLHPSQNNACSIKKILGLMEEKANSRKYAIVPVVLCPLSIKDVGKFLEIKENDEDFFFRITVIPNIYERELKPKTHSLIKYEIHPMQLAYDEPYYDLKTGICEVDLNTINVDIGKEGKPHIFKINPNYTYTHIENDFAT